MHSQKLELLGFKIARIMKFSCEPCGQHVGLCGSLMTCMVKMPEFPGSVCEPHSQSAGAIGICYDMHSQNAGKSWIVHDLCLNFWFFGVNSTIKMLEFLGFFVNSTVKSKARFSFQPVANRLICGSQLRVFFRGTRGSFTWPGLESVAAATSKTAICKKHEKIQK